MCAASVSCNALATEPRSDEMTTAILRGTKGEFQEDGVTSIFKKAVSRGPVFSYRAICYLLY